MSFDEETAVRLARRPRWHYREGVSALDPNAIRQDFPILSREIHGKPLVYLDNAATSQKPFQVLKTSRDYYEEINANIHRGVHHLAQAATTAYEAARETVRAHLNAQSVEEIVFTSGTTDAINLVASVLGRSGKINAGDEIIISGLEHHSNIVPWQILCEQLGISLKIIPVREDGTLDLAIYETLLTDRTKLVSINHISNAFGTVNDVDAICHLAKQVGALTLIDGAQSIAHLSIDVQDINADFYAFSGHKVYAPTGIGVLWARRDLLEELPPWKGGGEMIKEVSFEKTTYNDPPFKYEAGTPNIEGAIALAAALNYVNNLGIESIHAYETQLIQELSSILSRIPDVTIYGPHDRSGAISFNIKGVHHYDLGTLLDQMGFALRTGHHCCQPLMARFGITGTLRASVGVYNTIDEVHVLGEALERALKMLR